MALSGSFQTNSRTWTASDGKKKTIYYLVEWTATQSIPANASTLTVTVTAKGGSTYSIHEKNALLQIDGADVWSRSTTVDRKTNNVVVMTGTFTVNHNADGNKTISMYFGAATGATSTRNVTGSSTFTLDWIPRQSPISTGTEAVVVNGTNKHTVTWAPYVSSYSHKVTWSIGSYSYSQTIAAGTKTASYAIPKDWLRAIPSATSGTATVKLETFDGSTQIGGASTQTFTIKCVGNETPNCSVAASDANGYYGKIAAYIINLSKIKVDVSGITYQYGASLKSISVTIGNDTYTGTAVSVTAQSNITAASTAVMVVLTDSRGYSVTKTLTVTAYTYKIPALSLNINRYHNNNGTYEHDDEGEYGRCVYTASISQIGNNALQGVTIEWAAADGSGSGNRQLNTMTGDIYVVCDTEKVFTFTLTISDKLNTVVYKKQLSSAMTIMDIIRGGNGVCFGGVAIKPNTFDVRWPIEGSIKTMGDNVITATTSDTVDYWASRLGSVYWFSQTGCLRDQPTQWGFLINMAHGNDVHQLWLAQGTGVFHRLGNANGWQGTWKKLGD